MTTLLFLPARKVYRLFRYQTRPEFLLEIDAGYCLNIKSGSFVITAVVSRKLIKKIETVERVFFGFEIL